MTKAKTPSSALRLEQVPNIGPAIAADLRLIEIAVPADLRGADPLELYRRLERRSGERHDPCVLDTFMAAVAFMNGRGAKPWWEYTKRRKRLLAS